MDPRHLFAAQFVWFFAAWVVVATQLIGPRLRSLPRADALAVWIAPQMFRVLGLGLLVPALAPGMPEGFARSTALGDSLTAVLAFGAVIALRRRLPGGIALAWGCTLVGLGDLLLALKQAPEVDAAVHLAAQWYVPALGVPLMIVAHGMALAALLGRERVS
ncbi:MAG: hypothetical protein KC636_25695 [Myxococcales bacterium]|nr:hypothetical protein [Myxococcales bacterium]